MTNSSLFKGLLAGLLVMVLQACSQGPAELTAAPLGDRSVLEDLADAYTEVSNGKLAASPMTLPGDKRKQFLEEVFAAAGFSYSLTLSGMASEQFDKNQKLHRDLADLVLMPHRNQRNPRVAMDRIYTAQELQDIAVIERSFNM